MIEFDVDQGEQCPIRCTRNRTFDLSIPLGHATAGKSYKLDVRNVDSVVLSFSMDAGISIQDSTIRLRKNITRMNIPTGTYNYDLVEINGNVAKNLYYGPFIVQPNFTEVTIPSTNRTFPFTHFPIILS